MQSEPAAERRRPRPPSVEELVIDASTVPVLFLETGSEVYDRSSRRWRDEIAGAVDRHGYVLHEYMVSGLADAYDPWGRLLAGDEDYLVRVLVVRPGDDGAFSGTVFLDPLHIVNEAPSSTYALDWMGTEGHAWVGVTIHNGTFGANPRYLGGIKALRHLDPARYASLRLGEHDVAPPHRMAPFGGTDPFALWWSMGMAHPQGHEIVMGVAEALRTTSVFGCRAERIYACGLSQIGSFWTKFVENGFAAVGRSTGDGPLFDAYVVAGFRPPVVVPDDAVLVSILGEAEVVGTIWPRGVHAPDDSDEPRVRGIEIAGAPHSLSRPPDPAEHRHNTHPVTPFYVAVLAALDEWVRGGRPMPRVPRIERDSSSLDGVRRDEHGNALGGLRVPWLEAPHAQYLPRCACSAVHGERVPLPSDVVGAADSLLAAWQESVAALERQRLLTPAGAAELVALRDH